MLTALITLMLALLVGWLYVRRRQRLRAALADDPHDSSGDTAYHSVSIKYAATACRAARALEGRRYLANSAPRIPLPECDVKKCECRFAHYEDRRTARERRTVFTASGHSAASASEGNDERRDKEQRRKDDDPLD